MPPQAAARLARANAVLIRKHCMMVTTANDPRKRKNWDFFPTPSNLNQYVPHFRFDVALVSCNILRVIWVFLYRPTQCLHSLKQSVCYLPLLDMHWDYYDYSIDTDRRNPPSIYCLYSVCTGTNFLPSRRLNDKWMN